MGRKIDCSRLVATAGDLQMKKGYQQGIRNSQAKLNDNIIREIRTSKISIKLLALKYEVKECTIYNIISRKRWSHVL